MADAEISKTAQVNLQMLADLGIPEAVRFRDALELEGNPLKKLARIPFANQLPLCISTVSEILYERTNDLIIQKRYPTVLDLACGYSPRVLAIAPRGFTYIGADLPGIANELAAKRAQLIPNDPSLFAGYRCIDVTDREQMEGAVGGLREQLTIVTQGLLTYLTLDQKRQLMESVHSLLSRDGGCWIIPDAHPDRMLNTSFESVLGKVGGGIVKRIYGTLDAYVGRSRSENGWQTIDEICAGLEGFGFAVERVPLYHRGLTLWCLDQMDPVAAERLVTAWSNMSSLVVTVPDA